MYSTKISNDMTINKKTGEVKLNALEIKVDGFSDSKLIEKAKENYNSGKTVENTYSKDWPKGTWHEIYYDLLARLLKWRKRAY